MLELDHRNGEEKERRHEEAHDAAGVDVEMEGEERRRGEARFGLHAAAGVGTTTELDITAGLITAEF